MPIFTVEQLNKLLPYPWSIHRKFLFKKVCSVCNKEIGWPNYYLVSPERKYIHVICSSRSSEVLEAIKIFAQYKKHILEITKQDKIEQENEKL